MEIKIKTNFTVTQVIDRVHIQSFDIEILDRFKNYISSNGYNPDCEDDLREAFLDFLSWDEDSLSRYKYQENEELRDVDDVEILNWEEIFPLMTNLIISTDCCVIAMNNGFKYCPECGKPIKRD